MARTSTTDPLVGDVLDGRYEVLQRLARGGMATVYRAWDRRLERIVAIKVMHEGLGDDGDFAAKFDREARAAARLCDQSVVSIFDQGHDHGRPYIVMEFVEGSTLRTVITQEAPLSPLRALQLIEPVAAALATAHESGLVHRDVKPENVLISDRGIIKVADFGLARAITNQTNTHTQGLLIGTVSYLPPELLTSGRAHSWSDVYSTGIMLFEMLTGTKPYTGDAPITVAYKHVNEDVPAPSTVLAKRNPGQARREPIPDYVDALVLACTRRDPGARPVDGRELLYRIRRIRSALERGVRGDEALVALAFPSSVLPRSSENGHAIGADGDDTSMLDAQRVAAATPALLDDPDEPLTPVQPMAAITDDHAPAGRPVAALQDYRAAHEPSLAGQSATGRNVLVPATTTHSSERFPKLSKVQTYRRRRAIVLTVLVLLLTLGLGTGGWWFFSGRYITTPSLINSTQDEAIAIAAANGMPISFTEDYSETVPAGQVISSDPGPGDRVIRNTPVSAVLSLGPERFAVPALAGLSLEEAQSALAEVNLVAGTLTEAFSDEVAEGIVIQASAEQGTQLKRGDRVDLTISKGREPLTIPNVVNVAREEAEQMLTEAGFKVEVAEEKHDDTVPRGAVISQEPANGTGFRGDTVSLTVSAGPKLVKVPRISAGDALPGARTRLEAAGLVVEVIRSGNATWPEPRYRVERITDADDEELEAGDEVPENSTVKVYVKLG